MLLLLYYIFISFVYRQAEEEIRQEASKQPETPDFCTPTKGLDFSGMAINDVDD